MIDLSSNCVSQYKMNDNAASMVVVDSVGSENGTATKNTNLMTTAGKLNTALQFTPTTDYVGLPNFAFTDLAGGTIAAWIYPEKEYDPHTIISAHEGTDTYNYMRLHTVYSGGMTKLEFTYRNNAGNYILGVNSGSVSLSKNVWHFVCYTSDSTGNSLWIDGQKVESPTYFYGDSSTQAFFAQLLMGIVYFGIGVLREYGRDNIQIFDGKIDNVMIFNEALSAEEIALLYNDGNGTEELSFGAARPLVGGSLAQGRNLLGRLTG